MNELARIIPLVAQGNLTPVIDCVLPLQQAAETHKRLEDNTHFG